MTAAVGGPRPAGCACLPPGSWPGRRAPALLRTSRRCACSDPGGCSWYSSSRRRDAASAASRQRGSFSPSTADMAAPSRSTPAASSASPCHCTRAGGRAGRRVGVRGGVGSPAPRGSAAPRRSGRWAGLPVGAGQGCAGPGAPRARRSAARTTAVGPAAPGSSQTPAPQTPPPRRWHQRRRAPRAGPAAGAAPGPGSRAGHRVWLACEGASVHGFRLQQRAKPCLQTQGGWLGRPGPVSRPPLTSPAAARRRMWPGSGSPWA